MFLSLEFVGAHRTLALLHAEAVTVTVKNLLSSVGVSQALLCSCVLIGGLALARLCLLEKASQLASLSGLSLAKSRFALQHVPAGQTLPGATARR